VAHCVWQPAGSLPPPSGGPRVRDRGKCRLCDDQLVYLAGDPSAPYEEIDPSGPRTLVEHTDQRCQFHQFLTHAPGRHVLPGDLRVPRALRGSALGFQPETAITTKVAELLREVWAAGRP